MTQQIPMLSPIAKPETGGFIDAYMEYSTDLASADELFHLSQGLVVVSVCVGRTPIKIIPKARYPNINSVVIGYSRFTHKSTAMDLAQDVIPDEANTIAGNWTMEAMNKKLAELENTYGRGELWYRIDEWATVLAGFRKKYLSQVKAAMLTWDDCKAGFGRETISRGEEKCDTPYPCSITATTRRNFFKFIRIEDIEDGFLSRKLIVMGDVVPLKPRRNLTVEDEWRKRSLKQRAKQIWHVFHECDGDGKWLDNKYFVLSKDALLYLNRLEVKIHNQAIEHPEQIPSLLMPQAYLENALKIACLFTVARKSIEELKGSNEIVVELEDLQRAYDLAKKFGKSAKDSINLIVKNVYEIVLEKIPFEPDKISRSDLSKKVYRIADSATLNTILRTATTAGEITFEIIKIKSKKTGREYPTKFYWRPTH